jgi:hypothetical protein
MRKHTDRRWVTSQFLRFFLIRLDGRTRFELTNDQPKGDLLGQAQNMLMHLFQDKDARKKVREPRCPEVTARIAGLTDAQISDHGLGGQQLRFKLAVIR